MGGIPTLVFLMTLDLATCEGKRGSVTENSLEKKMEVREIEKFTGESFLEELALE